MSETSLVLPGDANANDGGTGQTINVTIDAETIAELRANEIPAGAAPLADVEPELDGDTTQTAAFDSSAWRRVGIPEVDGVDAETIVIAFSGSVELDMNDENDLSMFNSLTLGREVELRVAGVVADKGSPLKVDKDGSKTMVRKAKVAVHTVYVPSPEQL